MWLILLHTLDRQDWLVPALSPAALHLLSVGHTLCGQTAVSQNPSPVSTSTEKNVCGITRHEDASPGADSWGSHYARGPKRDLVGVRQALDERAMGSLQRVPGSPGSKILPLAGV